MSVSRFGERKRIKTDVVENVAIALLDGNVVNAKHKPISNRGRFDKL
jgi:uncharacterized protein YbcI